MVISRKYARRLVRNGKAEEEGIVNHEGRDYMVLTRYDLQRTDHYQVK